MSLSGTVRINELVKDELCCMAVWLRAQSRIVELKDYLVAVHQLSSIDCIPSNRDISDNVNDEGNVQKGAQGEPSVSDEAKSLNENFASADERSTKVEGVSSVKVVTEELLYIELIETGCLKGDISTTALCWRFSLDSQRLKHFIEWGVSEEKLKVVTRAPSPGDDWGAS